MVGYGVNGFTYKVNVAVHLGVAAQVIGSFAAYRSGFIIVQRITTLTIF